jgi:UDP-N-acetylmuramyl pentapeptide phosphotransferase/UDP-N-acetylglucosamine-1-phosphate transferase
MSRSDRVFGRLLLLGAGALAARTALRAAAAAPGSAALERTNYRGRTVTLAAGPALAVGAAGVAALGASGRSAAAAAVVAGVGAGAVGLYDDVVGSRPEQRAAKGFAGHLTALRRGRVTSGLVKIVGVGAAGLAAAGLLAADPAVRAHRGRRRTTATGRAVDVLLGAGVIAGTANLLNLLDLRPGRALKAGVLIGAPLLTGPAGGVAAGGVGAAAGLLPADLDERVMLGDSGANALGALLGVALAARTGPLGRAGLLTVLAGLTAASEKVSFTRVIAGTPVLRELDEWGRRSD